MLFTEHYTKEISLFPRFKKGDVIWTKRYRQNRCSKCGWVRGYMYVGEFPIDRISSLKGEVWYLHSWYAGALESEAFASYNEARVSIGPDDKFSESFTCPDCGEVHEFKEK